MHAGDPARASAKAPDPKGSAAGLVVVGVSVTLWWPAFTLGAYGKLFFDQLLGVWAAATACLVVVLVQPRPYKGRIWQSIALFIPSLWVILSFATVNGSENVVVLIADLAGILVSLLGLPLTGWVLVKLLWPRFGSDVSAGRRAVLVSAVLGIAALSYVLGLHQSAFLFCEDFALSGNSNPPGCTPTP